MKDNNTTEARHTRVRTALLAVLIIGAVALIVWLIYMGYLYEWTGFGAYTTSAGEVVKGKTLWDWMELFIIPATLAVGGYWFSTAQKTREEKIAERRAQEERAIAEERTQEAALQTYLDQMSTLLIDKVLGTEPKPETKDVARVWTLTVLRRLDGARKGIVLSFLHESGLINGSTPIISLRGAEFFEVYVFAGKLVGANLSEAQLNGAKLWGVDLRETDLQRANMECANLSSADLRMANLGDALLLHTNLEGAFLRKANLSGAFLENAKLARADLRMTDLSTAYLIGADISYADLRGADLRGADLREADLRGAHLSKGAVRTFKIIQNGELRNEDFPEDSVSEANLNGAKYDMKTIWPVGFDPIKRGAELFVLPSTN